MAPTPKQLRGRQQTALRKLISRADRAIAQKDEDLVKQCKSQLNDAFESFEDLHNKLIATLSDVDEQDKEDNNFLTVEALVTKSITAIDKFLVPSQSAPTAVPSSFASELSSVLSAPAVNLPKYDGSSKSYYTFFLMFEESVKHISDDTGKFNRLYSTTTGRAQAYVASCVNKPVGKRYDEAKSLLKQRCGDDFTITCEIIKDLKDGKPVRSSSDLIKFADDVSSAFSVLSNINMYGEINTNQNIKDISSRLSPYLQNKWREQVFNAKSKTGHYSTFEDFSKFIQTKATEATDPLYGIPISDYKSSKSSASCNTIVTKKSEPKCLYCSKKHFVHKCSDFIGLDVDKRIEFADKEKLCNNCLRKGHVADACSKQSFCRKNDCTVKHNGLLHKSIVTNSNSVCTESVTNACANVSDNICMPVVNVVVNEKPAIALLDTGSSASFITSHLCDKLKLNGAINSLNLQTLNGNVTKHCKFVNLEVSSADQTYSFKMNNVFVIDSIPVNAFHVDMSANPHLSDIDVMSHFDAHVDLLIGQDQAHCFVPAEVKSGTPSQIYAVHTPIGWVLNGHDGIIKPGKATSNLITISRTDVQEDLSRLWDLDQIGLVEKPSVLNLPKFSADDLSVIDLWNRTATFEDGHWQVPIPWKENVNLPNNRAQAVSRLLSTQKSIAKRGIDELYTSEIEKLLDKRYAERVTSEPLENKTRYLPHHSVPKKEDKIRLVFDCSAKYQGKSLNDYVLQGPDFINKLPYVLLRFRQHPFAITGDIEAMYSQVVIPESDRDSLRFLWGSDCPKEYRMRTVPFGGIWSSSAACYALRRVADLQQVDIQKLILHALYVDDFTCSFDNKEDCISQTVKLKQVLYDNGFNLVKIAANDQSLLEQFPQSDCAKLQNRNITDSKTLGIIWNLEGDYFYFTGGLKHDGKTTKRNILKYVAAIFDPLGLISPFIVMGKVLFQEACRLSLGWDENVPCALQKQWDIWVQSLSSLQNTQIPRCFKPAFFKDALCEIHCFSDASEKSYGCCIYIRCIYDTELHTALLYSKHRLAPIKSTSIPRLELQAALLGAKVTTNVVQELDIPIMSTTFWVDSTIVLSYIANTTARYQVFVANRVAEIRRLTTIDQWQHISGKTNPADIVSRGSTPDTIDFQLWFQGPEFLSKFRSEWPKPQFQPMPVPPDDPELKKETVSNVCQAIKPDHPIDTLSHHYSSWHRLNRSVAWLLKLRDRLLNRPISKHLALDDMQRAERAIIQHVQAHTYADELLKLKNGETVPKSSNVYKLCPYIHEDGLLHVGGRLQNSSLTEEQKHPILIPSKHQVAKLILNDLHYTAHLGVEWIVSLSRKKYWIVNARKIANGIRAKCIPCKRMYSKPAEQQMAQLPNTRLQAHQPPFTVVGLDCFGPFLVKLGRSTIKRYACIYTCFSTRAVHIEKLETMDTDSMINSIRRFIARRGSPKEIFCDNGTNFTGACNELRRSIQEMPQDPISNFCLTIDTKWTFKTPYASHAGGVFERMIRTMRRIIQAVLNPNVRLTDEILETTLIEVEGIVNGRPITKISSDPDDYSVLTPNHFLIFRYEMKSLPGLFNLKDLYRRRWRHVQNLLNQFWKQWLRQYIPDLQKRIKWNEVQKNIAVGDLVLVMDENTTRGLWPLAIVVSVKKGEDDLVRTVKVKMQNKEYSRPISKLVFLEGTDVV